MFPNSFAIIGPGAGNIFDEMNVGSTRRSNVSVGSSVRSWSLNATQSCRSLLRLFFVMIVSMLLFDSEASV